MGKHVVLAFLACAGLASIVHAQPGGSQTQTIGGAASDSVGTAPPPPQPAWPSKIEGPTMLDASRAR